MTWGEVSGKEVGGVHSQHPMEFPNKMKTFKVFMVGCTWTQWESDDGVVKPFKNYDKNTRLKCLCAPHQIKSFK